MGLVGTSWRLAEDGSPHRAMRKCCQWESVASPNVANFQFGAGVWRGESPCGIICGERKNRYGNKMQTLRFDELRARMRVRLKPDSRAP